MAKEQTTYAGSLLAWQALYGTCTTLPPGEHAPRIYHTTARAPPAGFLPPPAGEKLAGAVRPPPRGRTAFCAGGLWRRRGGRGAPGL